MKKHLLQSNDSLDQSDHSSPIQPRAPKLQKCSGDQDASAGVEVEEKAINQPTKSESSSKAKLELRYYFLPTESGGWKLSPIEFERFGLPSITDVVNQSNDVLMFPSLPPVWKRDQLYVPESFKNQQSTIPIEERTNNIMYDLNQSSRPHRRMVLPQIYPNAIQTEQLNLLANQDHILDELKKNAPLTAGRDDPAIRSLFSQTTQSPNVGLVSATQAIGTIVDIEMKDTSQSSSSTSSSSSVTTQTTGQAEIDAAASKIYALDYSLSTDSTEFTPWMFHFHAQPIACERERKKSDEEYFNDLLLAKEVQEKMKQMLKSFKSYDDTNSSNDHVNSDNTTIASTPLQAFEYIYRDLRQFSVCQEDLDLIPTGELALFFSWYASESSHVLKSRKLACRMLFRHLLSYRIGQPRDQVSSEDEEVEDGQAREDEDEAKEEEMKDENEQEAEVKDENDDEVDEEMQPREVDTAAATTAAATVDHKNEEPSTVPTSSSIPTPPSSGLLDSFDVCSERLKQFLSFSKSSHLAGMDQTRIETKHTLIQRLRIGELFTHERAAIKGLLLQFALKQTDDQLLGDITNVLIALAAVEDFSGSWLTYIQVLAFTAGTYDQPIRTGVNLPTQGSELNGVKLELNCSKTYPLPKPYVCFSILFDLCVHFYMFSRNHFAITNGVFDLIQSIIGTTLIQRVWQPNEESHILNAVLECSRNSGESPAINLDGYLTYAIFDLFRRCFEEHSYSRVTYGSMPLSISMVINDWNDIVLHQDESVEITSSQPDVFTEESTRWFAPFVRHVFKESRTHEWLKQQIEYDQTQWRWLPSFNDPQMDVWSTPAQASDSVFGNIHQVKAWGVWEKFVTLFVVHPNKHTFDLKANLLDLAACLIPHMASNEKSDWYRWNGRHDIEWKDYDMSLVDYEAGTTIPETANEYLEKWIENNWIQVDMSGREADSSRQRLTGVFDDILGRLDVYAMRMKLELNNEMRFNPNEYAVSGLPVCLHRAISEYRAQPYAQPVPEGEIYQHLQELTPFEFVIWSYLTRSAIEIGLIQEDSSHPLGFSYVDPSLEYESCKQRDLSPHACFILETITSFQAEDSTRIAPHLRFLHLAAIKFMSESIHLSMRLQALRHISERWRELFPFEGKDADYDAKVELVKSFSVNELNITNVLVDIITDYALPTRALHHSYLALLHESVMSTFPLVRSFGCGILQRMEESTRNLPEAFRRYEWDILFDGAEWEAKQPPLQRPKFASSLLNDPIDSWSDIPTRLTILTASTPIPESESKTKSIETDWSWVSMKTTQELRYVIEYARKKPKLTNFVEQFCQEHVDRLQPLVMKQVEGFGTVEAIHPCLRELWILFRTVLPEKEEESDEPTGVQSPAFTFPAISLSEQFNFAELSAKVIATSEPSKPFSFNFGSTTSIGTDSCTTSSASNAFVFSSTASTAATDSFSSFSVTSSEADTTDPTASFQLSDSILIYLQSHSSDYADVYQHLLEVEWNHQHYDPQIWFRTLQPILNLAQNDVTHLITCLTELLKRSNLDSKDVLIILYAISPFIKTFCQEITHVTIAPLTTPFTFSLTPAPSSSTNVTTTAVAPFTFDIAPAASISETSTPPTTFKFDIPCFTSTTTPINPLPTPAPFVFNFDLPPSAPTAILAHSTPTPAPFLFNFDPSLSPSAPVVESSLTSTLETESSAGGAAVISIDPIPPTHQFHAVISLLIDPLFQLLQTENPIDVLISNLVSTYLFQLRTAYPLLITEAQAEEQLKQWQASCPPNSFQIEADDYFRAQPWLNPLLEESHAIRQLGEWSLPSIKSRFRLLIHLSMTRQNPNLDYWLQYLTTAPQPPIPPHSSQVNFIFLILCRPTINEKEVHDVDHTPSAKVTFLRQLIHLVEPLVSSTDWSSMDDRLSDGLIGKIHHTVTHIIGVLDYDHVSRVDMMVISRFIIQYLKRLGRRARPFLEYSASRLERQYQLKHTSSKDLNQTTSQVETGLIPSISSTNCTPDGEVTMASVTTTINYESNFGSGTETADTKVIPSLLHPFHSHPLTGERVTTTSTDRKRCPTCHLCGSKAWSIRYQCHTCSSGPLLCVACVTFNPIRLVRMGLEVFFKICGADIRQFPGFFSIIHPFLQITPKLFASEALNHVLPSLNTAVRGLASHPDRTLFYHAPRKGVRYTCLTCTKSYAETSSYYDPCDDSHWCFNCIEWTNQLTTSVRSREEFDRIYQLQLKEFHDQQLLTNRPPTSNTVINVSSEDTTKFLGLIDRFNLSSVSSFIPRFLDLINCNLLQLQPNSREYYATLADLSLTPKKLNDLRQAHIQDLIDCFERDLSSTSSHDLPTLSLWQQTYRTIQLLWVAEFWKLGEFRERLYPLICQVMTRALESEVLFVRSAPILILLNEQKLRLPKPMIRPSLIACNQLTNTGPDCITIGQQFELALLRTIGCSHPILRGFARSNFIARSETVPTLILMNYLNNKLEADDKNVLQPATLPPLTYSIQTIPFVYAYVRENFDSKIMGAYSITGAISQSLNSPVVDPKLREARAGLSRLIQQKWLSSLTFVEKVNHHQAICGYAKLVQDGINSSSPRTPMIPQTIIQFLGELAANKLGDELAHLEDWFRSVTQRSTAETVLFSQFETDDINTAIHDTPQLRSTLDAMVSLHTILPFLPFHKTAIECDLESETSSSSSSLLFSSYPTSLPRAFEWMLTRIVKSPLLRRLVIQPYYNLWVTCSMLRSYYLVALLRESSLPSPFAHLFLDRLKYPNEAELDMEPILTPAPGSIVLLTEILMYPPTNHGDGCTLADSSDRTIPSGLSTALPYLFDGMYQYVIQLVQVVSSSDGRLELPNLNELFTLVRGCISPKINGLVSPPPPTVGDTTIPCVFIDILALMIQTAVQLPRLTPHSQQSIAPSETEHNSPLELLRYRLVELLPIILATFNLYATTSLADLNGQYQPVLVSMRQYIRVIHQQLKKEKQLSLQSSTSSTNVHADAYRFCICQSSRFDGSGVSTDSDTFLSRDLYGLN